MDKCMPYPSHTSVPTFVRSIYITHLFFYKLVYLLLRADYAYHCRQIDSLRRAQLHSDKYFTLVWAAYTWASDKKSTMAESLLYNRVT